MAKVDNRMLAVFQQNPILALLPMADLKRLCERSKRRRFASGETIWTQDDAQGNHIYVLGKGQITLNHSMSPTGPVLVLREPGQMLGAFSILMNAGIAVHTAKAVAATTAYACPKQIFLSLCADQQPFYDALMDDINSRLADKTLVTRLARSQAAVFLARTPPFCALSATERGVLSTKLSKRELAPQTVIWHQDRSLVHDLLMVHSGYLEQLRLNDEPVKLGRKLAPGAIVGASDILFGSGPATMTLRTSTPVSLYALTKDDFVALCRQHPLVHDHFSRIFGKRMLGKNVAALFNPRVPAGANTDAATAQLVESIAASPTVQDISAAAGRLPAHVRECLKNGIKITQVFETTASVADAVRQRTIELAITDLGTPPAEFAFMILGSEGRREQTLRTDQDNAIIYRDQGDDHRRKTAEDYFIRLGERVCRDLDQAGYRFCSGEVMASNRKWCQPVSVWQQYFDRWIHAAAPEDLLHTSIFFDFRWAYGDRQIIADLRHFLDQTLEGWAGFLRHLTENALAYKPPVGIFRNYLIQSQRRRDVDLKAVLQPIIDLVRIYALKNRIGAAGTLSRLKALRGKESPGLNPEEIDELAQSFRVLQRLRLDRQITAIFIEKTPPDNTIRLQQLSSIDQAMLRAVFKLIESLQAKLAFEFTGAG